MKLLILCLLPCLAMGQWSTNLHKRSVEIDEFKVVVGKDAIPPIDKPQFWTLSRAAEYYFEQEPVIVLTLGTETKAYPLSILMYHEIVNDRVDSIPLTITFCPLCNAAIVFDRQLSYQGKTYLLDFGTTGMLRNSDLVMWDRQTESWWQQLTGEALVGELAGARLRFIPSQLISFGDLVENYPEARVLSYATGAPNKRSYGTNPYKKYDRFNQRPFLFRGPLPRMNLPPMERVVQIEGVDKVYPYKVLESLGVINDQTSDRSVVLFYKPGTVSVLDEGIISKSRDVGAATVFSSILNGQKLVFTLKGDLFQDDKTSSVWSITGRCIEGDLKGEQLIPLVHTHHFAFAWFAFHPDTPIYETR